MEVEGVVLSLGKRKQPQYRFSKHRISWMVQLSILGASGFRVGFTDGGTRMSTSPFLLIPRNHSEPDIVLHPWQIELLGPAFLPL
jgi:hypothetical protein